jgi:hypothetical protein
MDKAQRDLYWKLRALSQERSDVMAWSERYFLLVIYLDDQREAA